jgi:hypothetical protein
MALISIPNSIGGVSIPGALVNGPLGALFGNKFGRTDLQYPRDLQSSTRGHVVLITINEVQPATYESIKTSLLKAKDNIIGSGEELKQSFTDAIDTVRNGEVSIG